MSAWKPGDVALVDSWRGKGQIAFRTERILNEPRWCVLDGTDTRGLDDNEVTAVRPLVTIDPEDAEQVERLAHMIGHIFDVEYISGQALSIMLREFANPTPPTEPTDPRTRVEDRRENIWRLLADGDWVCTSGPDIGEYIEWSRLAAERGPLSVEVVES